MGIKKGFSLIEISITTVILALICSGMLGIFTQGFNYLGQSKARTIAYNLAREKLEEYSRLPLSGDLNNTEDYGEITDFPSFKRVVTIEVEASGKLIQIAANVYWNNNQENQSIVTLKADY